MKFLARLRACWLLVISISLISNPSIAAEVKKSLVKMAIQI